MIVVVFIRAFDFPAHDGPVGGASHETVQCMSGGLHLVFGAHGQRHLVASASITEMSEPDGSSDVPKAVHTCDTKVKVSNLLKNYLRDTKINDLQKFCVTGIFLP